MLPRLLGVAKYNRDWVKYVTCKYTNFRGDEPVRFRLRNGQTIRVRPDARWVLNEIYLDRAYEIAGVNLANCRYVLDLGANAGVFGLYAAAKAPQATIFCFEPGSRNFELLKSNIEDNRANLRPYQIAVAAQCGTGHLSLKGTSVEYALGKAGGDTEDVRCIDMEEVFRLTEVEQFDFVKMDVEGAELEILEGCTDQQLRRMSAIAVEWHHSTEQLDSMIKRFREAGFCAEKVVESGHARLLKARKQGVN